MLLMRDVVPMGSKAAVYIGSPDYPRLADRERLVVADRCLTDLQPLG